MSRGIGNNAPRDPLTWMNREIKTIKGQIRELMSGRRILNAAEIDEGGLQITNGGSLRVIDPASGNVVLFMGNEPIPDGSGRTQMSFWVRRDDGSYAIEVRDGGVTADHAHQQNFAIRDRAGNVVSADDTVSGVGIARPHLAVGPLQDTNVARWPATSATTWTSIATCFIERQHPQLTWGIQLYAPAGVTAQFRLLFNAIQVGTTQTVVGATGGTFTFWTSTAPFPTSTFGDVRLLELDAQVTAGTGTASAQSIFLEATQS